MHPAAWAAATGFLAVVVWFATSGERWVPILDTANLAFHEAGHPLFGLLFGHRGAVYGGTIGQLLFPLVAAASFWRRRDTLSFALCAAWFFQNFWNIARYMADARAQILPLVGGGDHDWAEIFFRWGVAHRDIVIAGRVSWVAWAGILVVWAWLSMRMWRGRGERAD